MIEKNVLSVLSLACNSILSWYVDNFMQANPNIFQLIIFSNHYTPSCITLKNTVLNSEQVVNLLGVHIDKRLTFSEHIELMWQKAGRSINV